MRAFWVKYIEPDGTEVKTTMQAETLAELKEDLELLYNVPVSNVGEELDHEYVKLLAAGRIHGDYHQV